MRRTKKYLLFTCLFAMSVLSPVSCVQNGNGDKEAKEEKELPLVTDSMSISKSADEIIFVDYDFQFLKPENVVADSINAEINEQCISGQHDSDIRTAIPTAMTMTAAVTATAAQVAASTLPWRNWWPS